MSFSAPRPSRTKRVLGWAGAGLVLLLVVAGWRWSSVRFRQIAPGAEAASSPGRTSRQTEAAPALPPVPAAAYPQIRVRPAGQNAADFYKSAITLLNALSKEERDMLRNPKAEVDADRAAALFAKIQPIMDLLRQAQQESTYCDWGTGELKANSPMPHLSPVIGLGQMAHWEAAYRLTDDPVGAVGDLGAMQHLARSMGDQAMIGYMVENSLDRMAITLLGQHAGRLDPAAARAALGMLQGSSMLDNLPRAMESEARFAQSFESVLSDPARKGQMLQDTAMWSSKPTDDPEAKLAAMKAQWPEIRSQMEWLQKVEQDFSAKVMLSDADFQAWWQGVQAQGSTKVFAEQSLTVLESLRKQIRYTEVNRAMATAGLAIMQEGASGAAPIIDPVTGRPFIYVEKENGFELRSPLVHMAKPVVMTFQNQP